ncbi:MAG: HprK-related kinase A [Burkholderiales bacterium]|nr:HprK-related kinase A [Burkholderiales bacterium]
MLIGELSTSEVQARLSGAGLGFEFGVARARVRSDVARLAESIRTVYSAYPLTEAEGFFDVTARLARPPGLRKHFRPQISFWLDGEQPFEPFPAETHLPLMEWGLNWAIANRFNRHLLLHAGVVERDGRAVLLPALPGSGKSTLTAALANRGFRLLSDEFGVVRLADAALLPLVRPTALKNESIEVMRRFAPGAVLGPSFPKTRKGTVAHLAPRSESVAKLAVPARPALILFPNFTRDAELALEPIPKSRAFLKLSTNSFNYELLGPEAFDAVTKLVSSCECYRLRFGDLEEAVAKIGALLASSA